MGRPATFVRLAGCNLKCEGCDTDHHTWREMSPEDVLQDVIGDRVVVTGGEPALQMDGLSRLIDLLCEDGKEVHMETNGTKALREDDLKRMSCIVVSPKRGSNVDLARWSLYENVHFKFVLGPEDWCWTEKDLKGLLPELPRKRAWIMPFGTDRGLNFARDAWDLALELGVNYSDRLHIRLGKR